MMTTISTAIAGISVLFVCTKMPLALASLVITQTMLISLSSFITFKTPWFSFILMMLFISGMMIIFVYVSSLASNEQTMMKTNYTPLFLVLAPFLLTLCAYNTSNNLNTTNITTLVEDQFNITALLNYKIYTNPIMTLTLTLIIYLLLALVVVVSITSNTKGPLRMKK
uniref:NADH dehydrogenase subunit 6 n=1 Tax=Jesogammarus hinumensis TaxID=378308 RepID=A0A891ZK37_9CRUS|nr:NADH dehydrogenase subunit 6 [Jesogammarus hinumensis]QRN71586.1 NADH dehydrogenase subunit 6 [Jesogammarus hinumensis]